MAQVIDLAKHRQGLLETSGPAPQRSDTAEVKARLRHMRDELRRASGWFVVANTRDRVMLDELDALAARIEAQAASVRASLRRIAPRG